MEHPKSYYRMTADGVVESIAMTSEEGAKLVQDGWQVHPQDARYAGITETEEPAPRKPGRPRK